MQNKSISYAPIIDENHEVIWFGNVTPVDDMPVRRLYLSLNEIIKLIFVVKTKLSLLIIVIPAYLYGQSVCATEIALESTRIPEGNFSILLYKPQRTELPMRERGSGITVTTYSYQSYFSAFDISYTAGFTDWTASKQYEIKKYGYVLSPVHSDLEFSVNSVKHIIEDRLRVPVRKLSSSETSYDSYPGRNAVFEFYSSGIRYIIRYRTYMIGYKEYWHQAVYPFQYERYARPEVFLNSFKLLPGRSR